MVTFRPRRCAAVSLVAVAAVTWLGVGEVWARQGQATPARDSRPASSAPKAGQAKAGAPARRATGSARSRAARARARLEAEARQPKFRYDETGQVVPDVRAAAAIVYSPITGRVLWADHANDQRSIASITKVMTAVVVLEHEVDLSREVTVDRSDLLRARYTFLRSRDRLSIDALLHLTLVASDNAAARALARVSQFGAAGFIERMNAKAAELGLTQTTYADPSGLDAANVSSAYDIARLISFAAGQERLSRIMRLDEATVPLAKRSVKIKSTNKLLGTPELEVRGGKTGFIQKAGYCLATLLQLPRGDQVAVVVLGARSSAGRFWETRHLVNWLAERGDLLDTLTPGSPDQP
jgi:D-alanyl-D-alanine endopeptidase (penicillin-binding protein 7)